ncbi:MAG: single-stranded DNA-binding protein [Cyanobium sp.]
MNHCLLEVEVLEAPQLRYTQDNQTPVAEMTVRFEGLRVDDPPGQIKGVGWGSVAQDLQNRVSVGQRLMLEGRLRMNTQTRPDGLKEKRAEITLSRLHSLEGPSAQPAIAYQATMEGAPSGAAASVEAPRRTTAPAAPAAQARRQAAPSPRPAPAAPAPQAAEPAAPVWNTSPLVPDPEGLGESLEDDDIPF